MGVSLGIHDWLVKHHRTVSRYEGKWIAVSDSGVVEQANSLPALSKKLTEEQKSSLLMTRIPTKKEATNLIYGVGLIESRA